MSETAFDTRGVLAACRKHSAALAGALNVCFERSVDLIVGETQAWHVPPESLFAAGLAVRIEADTVVLLGLIPAALPLPEWHSCPDPDHQARLQNLATEWAKLLLPEGLTPTKLTVEAVPDLAAVAAVAATERDAELTSMHTAAGADSRGAVYLLVSSPKTAKHDASIDEARPHRRSATPPAADDPRRKKLARLLNVPVQVAVHLADKKIEMDQVLALGPGSMIVFEKNCEDLLDLYVNNRLYARGEAVKIGENFGIKVCEVGSVKLRPERVY